MRFKTKATEGNLNNHIGVPLTLIRLDEDDEFGVVEMGMNHPGEIAPLAKMTAPEIGVISSIGPAHIEFFADQAAIAQEKADLIAALPPEGLAVLRNADDEWSRHASRIGRAPALSGRVVRSIRLGVRRISRLPPITFHFSSDYNGSAAIVPTARSESRHDFQRFAGRGELVANAG